MASRIVVIEEPLILSLLSVVLRRGGYQVIASASTEEAAKLTNEGRIRLLIASSDMPGAGEFAAALQNKYPELQVLLTCTLAHDECPFYGVGCLGLPCLQKPLDMTRSSILERVEAFIKRP